MSVIAHEQLAVGRELQCLQDEQRRALRGLVKAGSDYGLEILRDDLRSGEREKAAQAVSLAGSFGIRALVPELQARLG